MRRGAVVSVVFAMLVVACGSGVAKTAPSTTTPSTAHKAPDVPGLGVGVTPTEIKLGVIMIDFKCIESQVDGIYVNQEQAYNAFIDDINEHGGINGRKIVPVFKTVCPVPFDLATAACTSLTEDAHVFAVIGSMYDPAGDARQCITKQHQTVLITDGVSQAMIDNSPPGLLVTPNITPDRRLNVIMKLVQSRHFLDGKKVGVLTETTSTPRVKSVVEPTLHAIGVEQGSEAILSISGLDTQAAQAELDSFIERWKTEHVNALILVGAAPSSKQFVTKVKAEIPDMELIADTTDVLGGGQDNVKAHVVPNPYDGIITAEGRIGLEHSKTPHYTYCKKIFESHTGIKIPLPNVVIKLPNGKQNDIYGNAENACNFVTMFATIAKRVGKNLNNANWVSTVNDFGPIAVMNTDYASLHAGKYDADDTFGLVAFDPDIPPIGDWRHVTPTQDVNG